MALTPAELALDYDELTRYNKVRGALSGKLGKKVRKRLRKENAGFKKKISDPRRVTGPLTPAKLAQEAETAGNLKYGQALRDSEQMSANLPNWYDTWKSEVAKAEANTAAAWQQAAGATTAMQQSLAAGDTQRAAAADEAARKDAALRGASVDPSLAATSAQAQAARNQASSNFQALLGTQGAAQRGYLQNRLASVEPQKMAALSRESRRRSDLSSERGDYVSQYLADSRERERRYGLEQAAFGLDQVKAAQDAAADRSTARQAARDYRLALRKQIETERHNLATERNSSKKGGKGGKKPRKGVGSLTRGQENTIVSDVSRAQSWIKRLRNAGVPESEIRSILETGGKVGPKGQTVKVPAFDKDYVNAAYDLAVYGYLSRPNIRALHTRGLHIPPQWQKPKKPKRR